MVSAVVSRTNKGCTIHSGDIDGGSGDVCEVLVCVTTDREHACITEELVAKGVCIGCTHTGCIDNGDGVGSGESRTNKGCTIHSGDIDGGSGDVCGFGLCNH